MLLSRMAALSGVAAVSLLATMNFSVATVAAVPQNSRVTLDTGSAYESADLMGGTGTYTDATLQRCGVDQRMQNEPTVAIDPRNPLVQTSGANDYCTVPTNGDAWAGFYRSTDG